MPTYLYVLLLTASVALSALLTYWVRSTAVAWGLKATPVYGRHLHTKPLPRLGGIAICVTFMTAALAYIPISQTLHLGVSTKSYLGILIGCHFRRLRRHQTSLPKSKIVVSNFFSISRDSGFTTLVSFRLSPLNPTALPSICTHHILGLAHYQCVNLIDGPTPGCWLGPDFRGRYLGGILPPGPQRSGYLSRCRAPGRNPRVFALQLLSG
jgi:UDP-N-acetylmuramyl pentapeptide phosphotransferase/UDP-N-acetylglucosamine-1-phosphate transferase